ncbi:hypothetical protein TSUD_243070 [Trifolium subterraneum]|uniref:Uncharacterized protein n=1 Tax=Trifolium subterraneum TaxID=3900 RepID=A0A2Z6P7T0_TRISU|nr:hypothetical protein TSUD_243070 [Trifolium subterraneum]
MVSVATTPTSVEEPKLTIQSFHQCSSLISIKLSTSNFLLWKSQILPLIRSLGLEHHITADTSKPDDEITDSSGTKIKNPDAVQWILNDGLLTSWLLGNMKEETVSMILGGDTAHYIWSSLHEQLLPNTEDGEAQLKNSLYALSKGNLSLDEYIRKFKELCDKLTAIGKPVSDVDKVFQISKGLGHKYKEFRIAVLSKPPYPSFNQFIMSLQNFEQVYLTEEKSDVDHNQAFFGQRGRGRNTRGGRGNFRGRGSYSSMQNRPNNNSQASNSTSLPKYNNNWRGSPKQQSKEPCQICGRTNHIAPNCFYRYEYNTEIENTQEALAALTINEESDPNFYADSGATTHMTNKGGNLSLKPYFGTDTVFVGNGQALPITHTGKALLKTTQAHQILARGHKKGSLYALEGGKIEALTAVKEAPSEVWHARLGHPNVKFLQILDNKKVINVSDWKIKVFQSDGGGEFTSKEFSNHLAHCVYLINRLPILSTGKETPYSKLFGKNPDYSGIRYSPLHKGYRCLDPHTHRVYISRHVVFNENHFPYSPQNNSMTTFSHDSSITTFPKFDEWFSEKVKDVTIHDDHLDDTPPKYLDFDFLATPPPALDPSSRTPSPIQNQILDNNSSPIQNQNLDNVSDNDSSPIQNQNIDNDSSPPIETTNLPIHIDNDFSPPIETTNLPIPPPTRSSRDKRPPAYLVKDYHCPTITNISPPHNTLIVSIEEPKTYKTALKYSNWQAAMQDEIDALHSNNTWTLVQRPLDANVIGSKWVFRTKLNEDGSIDRFKARLVAKGYTQIPGLDFGETFSPVIKAPTIRIILSLAVHFKWPLKQLDVKNAFLHGTLNERVYMEQPPGFEHPHLPNHVCQLHKSLYGLKQAPRAWFEKLSACLISLGFICSKADPSLFIHRYDTNFTLLLVYVDDIILTGNAPSFISHLVKQLHEKFALKDLGQLHYFLGIEIKHFCGGITISQTKYAHDLLKRAHMLGASKINTPIASKPNELPDDNNPVDATEYRRLCGSLQYLTFTRPDLTHAVNLVCQHFQNPTQKDLQAVKRILRYIKGTLTHGLRYLNQSSLNLTAFCDADWAGCPTTRRSTTGFCIYLGSHCISWASKKQPTVSRSSAEAEYKALATTAAELTWLQYLLHDLGISLERRPLIFCDNQSAIHMSHNPVFHARTKHIAIDYHFIREKVTAGDLRLRYLLTTQQIADVFTKSLPKDSFSTFRRKLGVHCLSLPSLKGGCKEPKHEHLKSGPNCGN